MYNLDTDKYKIYAIILTYMITEEIKNGYIADVCNFIFDEITDEVETETGLEFELIARRYAKRLI